MFEDSTFESGSRISTQSGRWMGLTGAMNGAVLALLVLVPLIYPNALPRMSLLAVLTAPPAPPPVQTVPVTEARATHAQFDMMDEQLHAPRRIPTGILIVRDPGPPQAGPDIANMPLGNGEGVDVWARVGEREPKVQPAQQEQLAISQGVAEGMLIRKTVPAYPPIARAAGVQGTVVLHATIGKDGRIEDLQVLSGPQMLRGAAVNAVKTWLYKPYLLNGQPVAVETTIEMTFTLGVSKLTALPSARRE